MQGFVYRLVIKINKWKDWQEIVYFPIHLQQPLSGVSERYKETRHWDVTAAGEKDMIRKLSFGKLEAGPNLNLVLMLLVVLVAAALGQTSRGTVSGTVTDSNGAVIAGAKVELINKGTGVARGTLTNNSSPRTLASKPTALRHWMPRWKSGSAKWLWRSTRPPMNC